MIPGVAFRRHGAVAAAGLCCVFVACASAASRSEQRTAPPNESLLRAAGVGANVYTAADAGETRPLDAPYDGAPPLVPHATAKVELRRTINECFDCHVEGDEIEDGHRATKLPDSHFVNEFTGERVDDRSRVVGARYTCTACHVPQAEASPPVALRAGVPLPVSRQDKGR